MCGRYYIASEDASERIEELIDELNRREAGKENARLPKLGEVFPTDPALVVANNRQHVKKPFVMRWGFRMKDGTLLINARSESVFERKAFRELIHARRLLVPASGYFEWEKNGKLRTKYDITVKDKCVFMAGLYRPSDSGEGYEFVILTREAAPHLRFIHPRMPVILAKEDADAWLNADADIEEILNRAQTRLLYQKAEGMGNSNGEP